LAAIPGVGLLTATAIVATVGDARQYRNGRQFAAALAWSPSNARPAAGSGSWESASAATVISGAY
jgi:transposase